MSRHRWTWLHVVEWVVALTIVAFLIGYFIRNGGAVARHPWTFDVPRLVLASLMLAASYSGMILLWRHILGLLGGSLSVTDAHRIWYLSNLGRYVPGKVLNLVGVAYLARNKGVNASAGVASSVTAQAFVVGSGLLIATLAGPAVWARGGFLVPVAGIVFAVIVATPLFDVLLRLVLKLTGRAPDHVVLPVSSRLALAVGYGAAWIVLGGGFAVLVSAVTPTPAGSAVLLIGIYAAGYVAGYVVLIAPGGLGVREGVYALLLSPVIGPSAGVAVALLARMWSTVVEVVVVLGLLGRFGVADLRAARTPEVD